jgi:hypothetical protein
LFSLEVIENQFISSTNCRNYRNNCSLFRKYRKISLSLLDVEEIIFSMCRNC